MKKPWPTKKLGEIVLTILFVIFATLFFYKGQYWPSIVALALTLPAWRINDLLELAITREGFRIHLSVRERISEIIRSDKPIEEKVRISQELIDKVFRAGYMAAGGKTIGRINNVKIWKDDKGNTTIQYDET